MGAMRASTDGTGWPALLLGAVLEAAEPGRAVREANVRGLLGADALGATGEPVRVLAIGKASLAMARAAGEELGRSRGASLVLAPADRARMLLDEGWRVLGCDHPYPTERNVAAAADVEAFVRACPAQETLLVLLSGGASAYLASPAADLTLGEIAAVTRAMQLAGASIHELNTVRKHVERLKGGRLGAMCAGRVVALVMSDVIGDPLEVIGSGPLVPDPTTFRDAISILERLGIGEAHAGVMGRLKRGAAGGPAAPEETPKPGDPRFASVTSRVIANNARVVEAAATAAKGLGWSVAETRTGVQGSSRDVAAALMACAKVGAAWRAGSTPVAWIWGGETTVDVGHGTGLGGPSQELALEAALLLAASGGRRSMWLWAFSTDGRDGPTDAAGAIVGRATWRAIAARGHDPAAMLRAHDSHAALASVDALIRTGPTGTNLNHVWVLVEGVEGVQ